MIDVPRWTFLFSNIRGAGARWPSRRSPAAPWATPSNPFAAGAAARTGYDAVA